MAKYIVMCAALCAVLGLAGTSATAKDGTITTFDPSGSVETLVGTINDAGTIVGTWLDSSYVQHSYLRASNGSF